jgi:hypothetical protein
MQVRIKQNRKHEKEKKSKTKKREKKLTWPQPIKPAQLASLSRARLGYRFGL